MLTNQEKLAKQVAKLADKADGINVRIMATHHNGRYWVTNGHWAVSFAPEFAPAGMIAQTGPQGTMFYYGKAGNGDTGPDIPSVLPRTKECVDVVFSKYIVAPIGENTVSRAYSCGGKTGLINEKYREMFELLDAAKEVSADNTSPIAYLDSDGNVIGVCMPVRDIDNSSHVAIA